MPTSLSRRRTRLPRDVPPEAADPHGDPAVEAPTEEASEVKRYEVKRYNDASDEPFGGEVSEGETAAAPAAEDEDGSAAEGAGFPDVPLEAVEVESPPIVPVDLDEDRPRIDIEAANLAERSIGPAMDVESVAARRFQFDLGTLRAGRCRICKPLPWRW